MPNKSEITYSHEWIYELENKLHWTLYWHQLNLVLNVSELSKRKNIIEIGVGSGMVSSYLQKKGYDVTTIDIDKNKNPEIVANVVNDDIPSSDIYLAFEIFEHIPFEAFKNVLGKLENKKVEQIIFSIPHAYKTYLFCKFWLPFLGEKTFHIGRARSYINTKNHHWELGVNGITTKTISKTFEEFGYKINHTYRYRNHQFYIANLLL